MYIEQIILNGFKSYKDHTVIDGFDPYFNAITGRNGSGKSNIFDAICWVLGMGNISNLRADGMQGLIYKGGTSGPKQASVEIIFNNEDKNSGPVGYRNFDKISVKRTVSVGSGNSTTPSKYYINGALANSSRVQNLFHSVQLNVNNPHFLIQQGRITKILNMHPPEILKLVEEAAGISMFENKKEDAVRTLEKKQHQLDEINRIMEEELKPNLEKLRQDKENYQTWINSKTQVDRLSRWLIAHKYASCEREINESDDRVAKARRDAEEKARQYDELQEQYDQLQQEIDELEKKDAANASKEIQELTNEKLAVKEKLDTAKIHLKHAEDEIKRLTQKREKLQEQWEKHNKKLQEMGNIFSEIEGKQKENKEICDELENRVKSLEKRITDVNIGITNEDDSQSLSDQIEKLKRTIADLQVEQSRIEKSNPHLEQQQRSLVDQLNAADRDRFQLDQNKERIEGQLQGLEQEMQQLNFDPRQENILLQERDTKSRILAQERDQLEQLERSIVGINIDYVNKPPELDERRIYGTIIDLITLRDNRYAFAAENAAGGRLYNIVTEDTESASILMKDNVLRRRSTVIPLNKIQHKEPSQQALQRAREIDPSAHLIVDELEYDPRFDTAIKFVFNNVLVVDTLDGARKVAFDSGVRMKCVTLDGDFVDPAGTLSGGSRQNSQKSIIANVTNYKEKCKYIRELKDQIEEFNHRLSEMAQVSRMYREMNSHKDVLQHELEMAIRSIKNSRASELQEQYDRISQEIEINNTKAKENEVKINESKQMLQSLTEQYENWNAQKNLLVNDLENQLAKAKTEFENASQQRIKSDNDYEAAIVQKQELEENVQSAEREIKKHNDEIQMQTQEKERKENDKNSFENDYNQIEEKLSKMSSQLKETNKKLKEKRGNAEQTKKSLQKLDKEKKECATIIENANSIKSDLESKIRSMIHDSPWIEQEKRFFGVPHTDFDFTLYDRNEAKKTLKQMTAEQNELENVVNKRVVAQYDKAEHELDILTQKKETVEEEKEKILDVIRELEQKKEEALTVTHKKVNADLKEIVSHLLSGAEAYLEDVTDEKGARGFELGVKLTGVRKGLLELSGGQRSLIALGLVLALLKFNPAPIYILDEVDAALDLGHTQDIGRLFRTQFKSSQFIVISLKEGLYKYANVLFRTSFSETSRVQRIVQRHD